MHVWIRRVTRLNVLVLALCTITDSLFGLMCFCWSRTQRVNMDDVTPGMVMFTWRLVDQPLWFGLKCLNSWMDHCEMLNIL